MFTEFAYAIWLVAGFNQSGKLSRAEFLNELKIVFADEDNGQGIPLLAVLPWLMA